MDMSDEEFAARVEMLRVVEKSRVVEKDETGNWHRIVAVVVYELAQRELARHLPANPPNSPEGVE
jgi:hypothetical protein